MKLVVVDGPMRGRHFPLGPGRVVIGRAATADVPLPLDPLISRFHCQLVVDAQGITAEDLGSGNGTWLGAEEVDEPVTLAPGALVRLGHTHVALLSDDAPLPPPPTGDEATLEQAVQLEDDVAGRSLEVSQQADPRELGRGSGEDVPRLRKLLAVHEKASEVLAGKLEERELLGALLDALTEAVPADRAFALRVDPTGTKLTAVASRLKKGRESDLRVSRTLLRLVVREKVAALVHDVLSDDLLRGAQSIVGANLRSVLCVPAIDGGRVAALLYLDSGRINAFSEEDLALACAVANDAGAALANARLYGELRRAYDDLESAHDRMVEGEKLSIIGTLAASIAHDMGNVITPITGVARMLTSGSDVDPALKGVFDRQIQRLKALTTQLKSMAKPKPPELVATDLRKVVEDAVGLIRTEARHAEVKVTTDVAAELPLVKGDANRLDQVLVNLMVNAVHAMGEKGGELKVRAFAEGGMGCVAITDTGPGIAPEHQARLFEAFFTTKGKKGTGLGLFSSKRIVEEEHRGKLDLVSRPGHGATFTVRIPLAS